MINKYFLLLLSLFLITGSYSQKNINNYKYVVVPKRFDFLKKVDQYQFNSLTKFLLEKENFVTYFDDESLPEDLAMDKCLALYTDVIDDSGLFTTKLSVILKNCTNDVIFSSRVGDSKEKEYKKAYYEAIREAFESFKPINYQYKPRKSMEVVATEIVTPSVNEKTSVISESENVVAEPTEPELLKEIQKNHENFVSQKPIAEIFNKALIAKPIDFGYSVLDSSSKEVMILLMTGSDDIFIVKGKNAIVNKNKNGSWMYSENDGTNFYVRGIIITFQ